MSDQTLTIHDTLAFICAAEGPKLRTDRDATGLIGEAIQRGAALVVVPAERLDDDFFQLRTRIAGKFIQKFVNYWLRLAIVGDIAGHVERSTALRDFIDETSRGDQIWFVDTLEDLGERLKPASARGS